MHGPVVVNLAPGLDEIVAFVSDGTILALDGNASVQYSAQQGGMLEVQVYSAGEGSVVRENVFVEDDGVSIAAETRRTSFGFDPKTASLMWTQSGGKLAGVETAYTHVRGVLFGAGGRREASAVPLSAAGRLVFA
jgi:hypothetical protein